MVTIPDAVSLGARSIPQSQRSIVSFDSGAGKGLEVAGKALQNLGDTAIKVHNYRSKENTAEFKMVSGQALIAATQADMGFNDYVAKNPDKYESFAEVHSKMYGDATKPFLDSLQSTPEKQKQLDLVLQADRLQGQQKAQNLIYSHRQDHSLAFIDQSGNTALTAVAADPTSFEKQLTIINGTIDASYARGDIQSQTVVQNKKDEIRKVLTEAAFSNMPPGDAYRKSKEMLSIGGSSAAPKNFNADTVKPYDAKRISDINALVAAPSKYDALFKEMGAKYGVDPQELKLRAAVESGLNPTAQAEATPYGQSGGLMQLEVETAKKLGVTDRNDPRQSVEGAAKLLAQHMKDANGDQSKVDKLYYAGSESMMGPNTEQYAANLAAVRGKNYGLRADEPTPHQYDTAVLQQVMGRTKYIAAQEVKDKISNNVAAAESGLQPIAIPEQDYDLLGEKDAKENAALMVDTAQKTFEYKGATPSYIASDLEASRPKDNAASNLAEQKKAYDIRVAAATQARAAWDNKPIETANQVDPVVRDLAKKAASDPTYYKSYFAALDETYAEQGITPEKRYLTESQSGALSANILSDMPKREDKLAAINGYAETYGKYWPEVFKQVAPKLGSEINTAIAYSSRNEAFATQVANLIGVPKESLMEKLPPTEEGEKKITFDNIVDSVKKRMEPLRTSLIATDAVHGGTTFNDIAEQAARVTLFKMGSNGKSMDDAADETARDAASPYIFASSNKGTFRIPVAEAATLDDAMKMQRHADEYLNFIKPDGWKINYRSTDGLMARTPKDMEDAIRYGGSWVTSPKEDGVILMVNGYPVLDKDNMQVKFKWNELRVFNPKNADVQTKKNLALRRKMDLPIGGVP